MTRKDFQLIAGLLKYPPIDNAARDILAKSFALHFELSFPHFNKAKFLEACGVRHD